MLMESSEATRQRSCSLTKKVFFYIHVLLSLLVSIQLSGHESTAAASKKRSTHSAAGIDAADSKGSEDT